MKFYQHSFPWFALIVVLFTLLVYPRTLLAQEQVDGLLQKLKEVTAPAEVLESIQEYSLSLEVGKLLTEDVSDYLRTQDFSINFSSTPAERLHELRQVLNQASTLVDLAALKAGDSQKFLQSLEKSRNALKPVAEFAKEYTLFLVGNSHIDMAWLWRWRETVEVCRKTFAQQLELMEEFPEYKYSQSQAQAYEWMRQYYPEIFEAIQKRVKEGRWEITGGMVVEPDCNLISGESWARQILYAKRYFKEKFGVEVKLGWNPDSFGYNWNIPQFYKKSGIDAFITQKISWNDTNVFPYHLFWWEAPDGSRILAYFPYSGYTAGLQYKELIADLKLNEANTGRKEVLVLFGAGDHGGGPNREQLQRAEFYRKATIFPNMVFSTAQDYLKRITQEELEQLPVWRDELYLEYHRGTYTTQAANKRNNRKSEILLTNAEKLASLAFTLGADYPQTTLTEAWWKVLFNQFHDILPGSSIGEVYRDAAEDYQYIRELGETVLDEALDFLAGKIDTKKGMKGQPLVVFNTLSWERDDLVSVKLDQQHLPTPTVFDSEGNEVPSQVISEGLKKRLIFVAEKVPALGYRVYKIQPDNAKTWPTTLSITPEQLENEFYRISVDAETGNLTQIFDKKNNRQVLAPEAQGNLLQLLEDIPEQWDAWEILYTGRKWELNQADRIQVLETGPVRAVLRVEKSFLGEAKTAYYPTENFPSSFFTQDIILYQGIPRIDFRTQVDWWEQHILLKVAFPLNVENRWATYEIPNTSIQRSTRRDNSWDKARHEVSAHFWADLSQADYGVSLLNESKYGHDTEGSTMRLTLLRSPLYPDPMADRGKHDITYSLYPHKGDWREGGTVRKGYELNYPLIARFVPLHSGSLPQCYSFVRLEPENIILTNIKKAEDSSAWIIRFYESSGQATQAKITLYKRPSAVYLADLMENTLSPVEVSQPTLIVPTGKNETVTLKIQF
ncbi:MAG: alpha-mannosidase [candidate division KSB1 bacterium]|nr:alpha-mannosidase [candidate division KSB1 bacterium]